MDTRYLLVLFSLSAIGVQGQPIIHAANHLPVAGTSRPVCYSAMILEEPPGGTAATWDFSWLNAQPNDTLWYLDPSNTMQGSAFGDAVAVVDSTDTEYANVRYLGSDNGGLYDAGYEMYYCPMSTNRTLLPPVLELGGSFSDTHGSSCSYETFEPPFLYLYFSESGTYDLIADGWGDLVMPWGVVENVLRTSSVWQYLSDNPPPDVDREFRQEITEYWHDGVVEPVVRIQESYWRLAGASEWTPNGAGVRHIIEIGLGMDRQMVSTITLEPNPTHDIVRLRIEDRLRPGARVELCDALGRVRWWTTTSALDRPGSEIIVDLRSVEVGLYTVRIGDGVSPMMSARVVKL